LHHTVLPYGGKPLKAKSQASPEEKA
jgi:hypothetical protein